jgi:GR25 family glycosyltransferase involved in LPS biosynthesis
MIVGSFINLDQSRDRLTSCNSQLLGHKLSSYRRHAGINGAVVASDYLDLGFSPSKLGCWLSHLDIMERSLDHDSHQHILEDDFEFTAVFKNFHDNFDRHASTLAEWDIVFCDVDLANMHNVSEMGKLIQRTSSLERSRKISFESAEKLYAAGNSSYIINKDSKQKVYSLMKKGLESGLPNDLYLRKLIRQGDVKACVTLPFVTTVSEDFNDSTILGDISQTNPSIMFATLFRRSLAWGADTRAILTAFRERINGLQPIDDRGMIYAQLVAHFVSDDYKPY